MDAVFDAMTAAKSHGGLQRQCCMFARSAGGAKPRRNAPLLRGGGKRQALIRAARNHPKECTDVGSAALRDLGCDNYNEGYNPTTAVMGAGGVVPRGRTSETNRSTPGERRRQTHRGVRRRAEGDGPVTRKRRRRRVFRRRRNRSARPSQSPSLFRGAVRVTTFARPRSRRRAPTPTQRLLTRSSPASSAASSAPRG